MLNGTIGICRTEGIGGIYRGLAPTVGRMGVFLELQPSLTPADHEAGCQQCCTIHVVRSASSAGPGHHQSSIGEALITSYICRRRWRRVHHSLYVNVPFRMLSLLSDADATMPFDNIKTRMQSIGASAKYRNSLDCFLKVRSGPVVWCWCTP